jgi:hypothetical protein
MFYYIEVHCLAPYIQLIKMHGETVKNSEINVSFFHWSQVFQCTKVRTLP